MGKKNPASFKRSPKGTTAPTIVWAGAVAAVACAAWFGAQFGGLSDTAALAAAESLLQSASDQQQALRQKGKFFGRSYESLLSDALQAEALLLGMKEQPELTATCQRMVGQFGLATGDLEQSFAASTRAGRRQYDPQAPLTGSPTEHHEGGRFSHPFTQRARLQHDVAQMEHLLGLHDSGGSHFQ